MRVRRIDESGDIATSGVIWLYDRGAVGQTIQTRLRLFLGEYFRDIQDGTPWFQEILGTFDNIGRIESIIKRRISETEGVDRILEFSTNYDPSTRIYSVNCNVLTQWGALDIQFDEGLISGTGNG